MGIANILHKIDRFVRDDDLRFMFLWAKGAYDHMADRKFLEKLFYHRLHEKLDIDRPTTFNEKLQWLKLNDYRPEYDNMVDKYEAKRYVAELVGSEVIIPTLGVWDRFEDIDFDALPEQFVLKCTHDSGGLVICKDKNQLDLAAAKKKIKASLSRNWFYHGREYPYKNLKPRIIAEQYMYDCNEDKDNLTDYKFFCFDGVPRYVMTVRDRSQGTEKSLHRWYDMDWKLQDLDLDGRDQIKVPEAKPEQFEQMRQIAQRLSHGLRHVRVDLYIINGSVFFGELTFYHKSGFEIFKPKEWDKKLGDLIQID